MESLYSIGLGLGLRFLIDTATKYHGLRVDGILIGLWEGVVLNHFARQFPSSFDPYIAFVFRMLIDFILTRNVSRMTVVILWTGLGMVLSDVFPDVNRDKRFRRMTRPFRRWFKDPNLDFIDYLPSLPSLSELADAFNPPRPRSRGRTSSSSRPTPARHAVSRTNSTTTRARSPVGESFVLTSRRHLPGNYTSETETTATNTNPTSAMSTPNPIMPPLRGILTPSRQSSIISPSPKPPSILNPSRPPTSILSPPQSTAFFPPNSSLSSPTREAPPQLQRSGIVSPPRSILSTPRSILSPPRQNMNNPPIIQQPAPRHPPPTSIISPPLSAPSPSIASPLPPAQLPLSPPHNSPPGGRESDFEYADIPYNHVPQDAVRPPRSFPHEVQSPPLIADPPHNLQSIPMPMPQPQPQPVPAYTRDLDQGRPRPLSDIPEATQSQEASQVSRLSHISHLSSRVSQALSNLPPPSEHTTEGDEPEYQSGLDSSQYDELDAFTTPPYLTIGSVIHDDDPINDPLMTPPGNTAARNMTGIGSGFGDTDRRGESDPLPQYQYQPFGALDDKQRASGMDLSGRGQPGQETRDVTSRPDKPSSKGDGADKPAPATKHKRTESSARPSMIPVRGNSVWGGSNLGTSEPAVRPPPPSSVGGGGSVWGDSTKDEEPATIRVRDPPAPKSNRGSIWGSLWGGSAKDEGSVRDDVSVREDIPVEPIRRDTRESRDRSVKAESVKAPRSVREPSAVRSTVSKVPSVRDDKSAIDSAVEERKRESPQPLSRQPTGNGSVRGTSVLGSVKEETKPSTDVPLPQPSRSVRGGQSELSAGGDNASVAGKTTKRALDDGKSVKERAAPLEDVDGQKKLNKDIESGAPPTPAKSTASISASASLWSEKPRLPELPPLQSPETPTIPDPITKNIEGLKGDEALKAVMDAWDQAVKARAPELKILVGIGKAGTNLKRKIMRSLEEQHKVTPAKVNLGEVIFRFPNIPPAVSN